MIPPEGKREGRSETFEAFVRRVVHREDQDLILRHVVELEAENERLRKAAEYERWTDDAACHDATCSYRPEISRRTIEAEQLAEQAEARLERAEQAMRDAKGELEAFLRGESGLPFRQPYPSARSAVEHIDSYFSTEGELSE